MLPVQDFAKKNRMVMPKEIRDAILSFWGHAADRSPEPRRKSERSFLFGAEPRALVRSMRALSSSATGSSQAPCGPGSEGISSRGSCGCRSGRLRLKACAFQAKDASPAGRIGRKSRIYAMREMQQLRAVVLVDGRRRQSPR